MGTPHSPATAEECKLVPLFSALRLYELAGLHPPGNKSACGAYLGSLEDEFKSIVDERKGEPLRVACFYDELPSRGLGWMAVPRSSAAPGGYLAVGIHAEQKDMARFASPEENGFKRLFGELARWVRGIEDSQPEKAMTGSDKLDHADSKMLGRPGLSCVEGSGDGEVVEIRLEDGAGAKTWSTGGTALCGREEERHPFEFAVSSP